MHDLIVLIEALDYVDAIRVQDHLILLLVSGDYEAEA